MSSIHEPGIIRENIRIVQQRIANACAASNRNANEVQLLLATKTVPADRIRVAVEAGERLTGENKVQELRDKAEGLAGLQIERHFIGHLQSNKIKEVLKYVSCIQSIDRLSIAAELDRKLQAEGRSLDIYVQVNTSAEDSKFGLPPEETIAFVLALRSFHSLQLKGLMTIGLLDADPQRMRPSLQLLRKLRDELLQQTGIATPLGLSMGMSGDLELAIAEGATMVRVGSAVFGNRLVGKEVWNEQAL